MVVLFFVKPGTGDQVGRNRLVQILGPPADV